MRPESFARWSAHTPRKHADFVIRMGAEGDIEACVRLVMAIGAGEAASWRQTLTRTVRDGEQRALFVAETCGQVVGYGRVVSVEADPAGQGTAPPGWYLLGLVVDDAWRRRGIGEALTTARMAWVSERSDRLYYFTDRGNLASQALHERLGFTRMPGTWVPPGGRPADAQSQQFYYADLRPGQGTGGPGRLGRRP
ncbi:MAG: GNAT family N-acetyltransferase [Actinobacteria bacterium]|nr:GNAT family N-acetyltransferase [Actinomycetota bacterium]